MTETFYSPMAGDPTPLVRIYLVGGTDYRKAWKWSEVGATDNTVTGTRDFTGWDNFTLKIAATDGGEPVALGSAAIQGDAAGGTLQLQVDKLETDKLQAAGLREAFGWLMGVNGSDTEALLRARVSITWATD